MSLNLSYKKFLSMKEAIYSGNLTMISWYIHMCRQIHFNVKIHLWRKGSGAAWNTAPGTFNFNTQYLRLPDTLPLKILCPLILFPEKAMAPHSSTLAWKIPWMEEAGRLQSVGSVGVGHDWATSLSLFTVMHWRRKWQPTPVFLPGESQGQGSLVDCRLWGRTELDTTEAT